MKHALRFRPRQFAFLLLLTFASGLVACGEPEPKGPQWDTMDYQARLIFMGTEVFAPMKKMMQTFDADRFKDFSCATCHGKDGEEKKYVMPNGVSPINLGALDSEDPKYVKFMQETFMPEFKKIMATAGHTSTKCLTCHASK